MSLVKACFHIIIRTKHSRPVFDESNKQPLYSYIGGILRQHGNTPMCINGYLNHIHILTEIKANQCVSDVVHDIKPGANFYIKSHPELFHFFEGWSSEYAAFSCSSYNCDRVIRYIQNQDEHHRYKTIEEELQEFCRQSGIEYHQGKD